VVKMHRALDHIEARTRHIARSSCGTHRSLDETEAHQNMRKVVMRPLFPEYLLVGAATYLHSTLGRENAMKTET